MNKNNKNVKEKEFRELFRKSREYPDPQVQVRPIGAEAPKEKSSSSKKEE